MVAHGPTYGGEGNWLIVDADGQPHREPNPTHLRNLLARTMVHSKARTDAKGRKHWGLHRISEKMRADWLKRLFSNHATEMRAIRGDSFDPGAGLHDIQDLTEKFNDIIREETPPLNAFEIWPTDTRVKPGMLQYRQSRLMSTAKAIVYRGGNGADIPRAGVAQVFQTAGVVYLISSAAIDLMEAMTDGVTNIDTMDEKMFAARLAIETLENKWTWEGSDENNLLGLLNHPFIDTFVSGVLYKNSTSTDDLIEDLARWANYAQVQSSDAFKADTMLISTELRIYLANRPRTTGTDTSTLQWFLNANPHITKVMEVQELNNAGGAGIHGMAFIRRGAGVRDASASIIKPMGITLLPADQRALGTEMYLLSGFGGLNHRKVGDSLVVYADTN
jgi:hypothetical protein